MDGGLNSIPYWYAEVLKRLVFNEKPFSESFQQDDKCSFIHGFGVALLLEWLLILTMFFGVFVTFNPQGNRRMERSLMIERRYWRRRFALVRRSLFSRYLLVHSLVQDRTGW